MIWCVELGFLYSRHLWSQDEYIFYSNFCIDFSKSIRDLCAGAGKHES